ncbi:Helix-turn-helix domain protein [Piscirickettsiaceae bacterium NZ-RLO1]|nr:Helix-turn-helix domain protein [Piscirickettsiaceae bacterium NZ-RLO1]
MSDEVKRKTELNLGELLQRARCNKNLTREQAARQLHIQPQILMLFEHNDFKQFNLPEHFIIEYLTNYASLLDLDANAVVAIYRQGGVVDLAAAPGDKKPVTDLTVGVKSAVNHQRNNIISQKGDVKLPTRAPESALSINNTKNFKQSERPRLSARKSQHAERLLSPHEKISAHCQEQSFEGLVMQSEVRQTDPGRKGRSVLSLGLNLLILIIVITVAFLWYKNQISQLSPATTVSSKKMINLQTN